jgi:hypothetical protein
MPKRDKRVWQHDFVVVMFSGVVMFMVCVGWYFWQSVWFHGILRT